jgi:hypothetical protein
VQDTYTWSTLNQITNIVITTWILASNYLMGINLILCPNKSCNKLRKKVQMLRNALEYLVKIHLKKKKQKVG